MDNAQSVKQRFLHYLPKKPYCSDNKTASKIRLQKYAVLEPYIQFNPPSLCAWLVFDIDVSFTGEWVWERYNLPMPNYIAMTKESQKYHIGYAINPVCTSDNAQLKPLKYMAAIQRTYKRLLGADMGYSHLITKNLLHPDWLVTAFHNHQYDLNELHSFVDKLDPKPRHQSYSELCDFERNVSLFNCLRYHAYAVVHSYDNITDFTSAIETKAYDMNNEFKESLALNELKGIIKSVSSWTWKNKAHIRIKERKLQLDENQPLATRQTLSAIYTHANRKTKTLEQLVSAYVELSSKQYRVTQSDVSDATNISIRTVKRHWRDVIN